MNESPRRRIPAAAVGRLPVYLRILFDLSDRGETRVSSEQLAELAGVNAAKVRKDLSHMGTYGTRGVGYDVKFLTYHIQRELGMNQMWPVVIVGAGNLGQALANYVRVSERGFVVVGIVDSDDSKVGSEVGGVTVRHASDLAQIAASRGVSIGVVATPADGAQAAAESLVSAGIGSILNFAPAVISVPEGVNLRTVDLALELQILGYHEQCRSAGRTAANGDSSAVSA